jgi:hypothetical protein
MTIVIASAEGARQSRFLTRRCEGAKKLKRAELRVLRAFA